MCSLSGIEEERDYYMLFLDANALYYFYGNEKLGQPIPPNIDISKLRSICEKKSDIALPSSAYMEKD